MGADRPAVEPADVPERIVRLVGRAAFDDRPDRARNLFGHDIGHRALPPPFDELPFDDAPRLDALFQTAGVPIKEFGRDRGEAVLLSTLRSGPLAGFLDLGIDPLPD
jgi:hypothetical protein